VVNESSLRAAVTLLERRGMSRSDAWVKVRAEGLGLMGVFAVERARKKARRLAKRALRLELEATGICANCEKHPVTDSLRCEACARVHHAARTRRRAEVRRNRNLPTS
jgi:hypothetical protein